jgi:glycosyltransferase involved in cell wall biosynthesis
MISVVIPTLNAGKFLWQTLNSIFAQDYSDYEVIVIDSFSDDDTLRIVRESMLRFNAVEKEKLKYVGMEREGQVAAINYGLGLAKGDILTYINYDDVYEKGVFRIVNAAFSAYQCQWLYGKGEVIDTEGNPTRSLVTKFKSLWWKRNSQRVLSWFDYIVQPTVFFKRSLWEKVGAFNPEYKYCMDYDYWLRCFKVEAPYFVNMHLANWRAHSEAISVRNTNAQIDESLKINLSYAQSTWDIVIQNLIAWGEKVVYGVIK